MKKNKNKRSAKQIENDIKNMFEIKIGKMRQRGESPPESFNMFLSKIKYRAKLANMDLKLVAKKALNAIDFTPYEERVHKNLTSILKEEDLTSRLYRMGGQTAFTATSFTKKRLTRVISGEGYHASGRYLMGTASVIIWTADDSSLAQYIEIIPMQGESYLHKRYGQKG